MSALGRPRGRTARWAAAVAGVCIAVSLGQAGAAALVDTVERITPSVVSVGSYLPTRRPPAYLRGTGFAVADGRHIITNAHVLPKSLDSAKKEQLTVFYLTDKGIARAAAEIVGVDRDHDLALLRLKQVVLPAMRLAEDNSTRPGQEVAATGFPIASVLGPYPTTHKGIVAAIKPAAVPVAVSKQIGSKTIKSVRDRATVVQLDITAFPGNSGSPVYDVQSGAVISVVNSVFVNGIQKEAAVTQPSGITYSIPVRYVRALLKKLGVPVI